MTSNCWFIGHQISEFWPIKHLFRFRLYFSILKPPTYREWLVLSGFFSTCTSCGNVDMEFFGIFLFCFLSVTLCYELGTWTLTTDPVFNSFTTKKCIIGQFCEFRSILMCSDIDFRSLKENFDMMRRTLVYGRMEWLLQELELFVCVNNFCVCVRPVQAGVHSVCDVSVY